jgi:hypothetical protein
MRVAKGAPVTTAEARARLWAAEVAFEDLTGLPLLDQDGESTVFVLRDGERVTGWHAAIAAAERLLDFAVRQARVMA